MWRCKCGGPQPEMGVPHPNTLFSSPDINAPRKRSSGHYAPYVQQLGSGSVLGTTCDIGLLVRVALIRQRGRFCPTAHKCVTGQLAPNQQQRIRTFEWSGVDSSSWPTVLHGHARGGAQPRQLLPSPSSPRSDQRSCRWTELFGEVPARTGQRVRRAATPCLAASLPP
eukprot:365572-Chlamydomonas_euryale.AAC.5